MIKRTQGGREWIDAQASMIETLTASEALPLDDPGQATLTGRLQALALLAVAVSVRSGTPRTSQDAARARPDPPSDAAPAVDQGLRCPLPRATPVSALAYQGHDQQSPAARLAYRTAIRGRRDSPARGAPVHDRGAPARVPAFARLRSAR